MSQRSLNYFLIFLLLTSFLFAACAEPPREVSPSPSPTSAQSTPASSTGSSPAIAVGHGLDSPAASAPAPMAGSRSSSSGDINWTMPTRWKTGPEKPMRAATYLIPAATGDSEGAECAVFMNIGGGVDANIKRWVGQFEQPDGTSSEAKAKQKKETINGFPVTTVDLTGIFTGGGMAMGQPSTKKPGYRLLGAIVEGPQGEIFFKLTGPAKTVTAAQAEFQALLKSLKK